MRLPVKTNQPAWKYISLMAAICLASLMNLSGCGSPPKAPLGRALQEGDKILDFSLIDSNGQIFRLSDLKSDWYLVIIFYRGSYCDSCRTMLFNLKRDFPQFVPLHATLVAISTDGVEISNQFNQQWQFPFPLLSDQNLKLIDAFGARHPNGHGIYDVAHPSLIIIDPEKVVRYKKITNNPEDLPNGHEILYLIKQLEGEKGAVVSGQHSTGAH